MDILSSNDYKANMINVVEPYISQFSDESFFERKSGERICYEKYVQPGAKSCVVISHGFSECSMKYHEAAYYFLKSGNNVYIINHRGHSKSFRMASDPSLVHFVDYRELILDFVYFAEKIVKPENPCIPCYVYAHSMGGAIAASAMEDRPDLFDKAVLTSPMMSINTGNIPKWFAVLFTNMKVTMGHGTDYFTGQGPFDGTRDFEHSTSAGQARYDYYFDRCLENQFMQTWGSSYTCSRELNRLANHTIQIDRCKKVKTPVLLFSAGSDNAVTDRGQRIFIDNIDNGKIVVVPGVRHEIFTADDETLKHYWSEIFKFFG